MPATRSTFVRFGLDDFDLATFVTDDVVVLKNKARQTPVTGCVDIMIQFLRYDIALLRLSSDATLNNYVQLGVLPPANQVLPHNNPCYISGWGRTQSESHVLPRASKNQRSKLHIFLKLPLASLFLLPSAAGGQLSAQLKQAYLPVVDHKTCTSYGWWGNTVKSSMVCAGGGSESGCQVCH